MVSIAKKEIRSQKTGRIVAMIVLSVFALVGGGLFYPFGIRPVLKVLAAEKWQETPCKIISAQVGRHTGDDGTTYSIDIKYEYQFAGRTYRSNKYYFSSFSSSGYKNKARIVEGYKKAENPVCFVNPENPSEAVLKRGFHAELLFALFPLPFLAIGVGGLAWLIKNPTKRGELQWLPKEQKGPAADVLRVSDSPTGPAILKPKHSPAAKLLGSIIFAVFWNGIVSVFLVKLIADWRNDRGEWFPTLFLIPFVIVGLLLIGIVFYSFLASFNPRPALIISSPQIPTGSTAHLDWYFAGRVDRLKSLNILLKAKEEASSGSGKSRHTSTNVFFQKEIYSASSPDIAATGQADFDIPAEAMHSFEASNNKILWQITVKGSIDKWPDISEEFKITVAPAGS